MVDITMCSNLACPLQDLCYRKTATGDRLWQSVQFFKFRFTKNGFECDYFIEKRFYIKDK